MIESKGFQYKNHILCIIFILACVGCSGHEKRIIHGAFMHEMSETETDGIVYFSMVNPYKEELVFNYAHTQIADYLSIHRDFYENGTKKSLEVRHLRLSPGEKLLFKPGGYSLKLFGLANRLVSGDTFEVVFEFENKISQTVVVEVRVGR